MQSDKILSLDLDWTNVLVGRGFCTKHTKLTADMSILISLQHLETAFVLVTLYRESCIDCTLALSQLRHTLHTFNFHGFAPAHTALLLCKCFPTYISHSTPCFSLRFMCFPAEARFAGHPCIAANLTLWHIATIFNLQPRVCVFQLYAMNICSCITYSAHGPCRLFRLRSLVLFFVHSNSEQISAQSGCILLTAQHEQILLFADCTHCSFLRSCAIYARSPSSRLLSWE